MGTGPGSVVSACKGDPAQASRASQGAKHRAADEKHASNCLLSCGTMSEPLETQAGATMLGAAMQMHDTQECNDLREATLAGSKCAGCHTANGTRGALDTMPDCFADLKCSTFADGMAC